MKIYRFWIALIGLSALAGLSLAEESPWLSDFAKAKELAAEKKLPILIDFAGTDWCGWCMKLNGEVLSQQAFKDYAKDHLILVLADFPAKKKLDEKTIKQNKELATRYGVKGFPTVLLVDADGKELSRTGYKPGGAETYVEHLKELLAAAAAKKAG